MKILSGVIFIGLVSFAASAKVDDTKVDRSTGGKMHVVLIGASIGKSWELPELSKRTNTNRYSFEALQVWDYDKSRAVEETLMRPARKFRFQPSYFKGFFKPAPQVPDLVILKECSSYFTGDDGMQRKKELLQQWVQEVRAKKIPVMVTTVAPITRVRAERDGIAKQNAIKAFNEWVRSYTREQKLPLLDIEKALRADDKERYLRDDLTSGDGSHLNRAAYDILDRVMLDVLAQVEWTSPAAISAKLN